jgi:hypothetical protein
LAYTLKKSLKKGGRIVNNFYCNVDNIPYILAEWRFSTRVAFYRRMPKAQSFAVQTVYVKKYLIIFGSGTYPVYRSLA